MNEAPIENPDDKFFSGSEDKTSLEALLCEYSLAIKALKDARSKVENLYERLSHIVSPDSKFVESAIKVAELVVLSLESVQPVPMDREKEAVNKLRECSKSVTFTQVEAEAVIALLDREQKLLRELLSEL